MKKLSIGALGLLALWAFYSPPTVQAECRIVDATPTYMAGQLKDHTCDTSGHLEVTISGGTVSSLGTSTAAAPSLVEGATASFSFDLAGNARFTLGTLISGEDQPNNLLMTSGGAVRQLRVITNATGNATGSTFLLPTGDKTLKFQLVCNAGASTNCGATIDLYGNFQNTTTNMFPVCTVVIPTGTATTNARCPTFKDNYAFYAFIYTGFAGTSPVLNGYADY